ncbi:Myb-like DNA-binding domain containing protein [Tritrichomonas foetus]|uniref:Myb-like DNA-binding domain containing protein n=1 Tax=Tritrichomonas foetus TaxID=1144522 RepID=A0A1J4JSD3_9EUKA|nr:Myb-like DNA-binding domain containing protein [Tritrichomonas foetus]|eukprot:OHT01674.1 Myb-like DNA-binding domain containing protein [Tritrichomonas foetus]
MSGPTDICNVQVISTIREKLPPRTKFTPEEDQKLRQLVKSCPNMSWKQIAGIMGNRSPRQCRERYNNYLSPEINHEPWTSEEDELLLKKFQEYGPQWAFMTKFFNSRSCVDLKNHHAKISNQSLHNSEARSPPTDVKSPASTFPTTRTMFVLPSISPINYSNNEKNPVFEGKEIYNQDSIPSSNLSSEKAFHVFDNHYNDFFNQDCLFDGLEVMRQEAESIYDLEYAFEHDVFAII